jgi:hypothetical protein
MIAATTLNKDEQYCGKEPGHNEQPRAGMSTPLTDLEA